MPEAGGEAPLWPLVVYAGFALLVVGVMLAIPAVLAPMQRPRARAGGEPYESGIVSTGSGRLRFSVKYYLVTMFFVIFDLEAVFIVIWAVAVRELGWTGYVAIAVFVLLLLLALGYLWRLGGLDWGTMARMRGSVHDGERDA